MSRWSAPGKRARAGARPSRTGSRPSTSIRARAELPAFPGLDLSASRNHSSADACGPTPVQAMFKGGRGRYPSGSPFSSGYFQAASARANAAICVQRGSISSPNRFSRSTASAASRGDRPSECMRSGTSRWKALTRKWPLPQQGSSKVNSRSVFGHPSNVPPPACHAPCVASRSGFPA